MRRLDFYLILTTDGLYADAHHTDRPGPGQGAVFGSLTAPLRLRLVGTRTFEYGRVLLEFVPAAAAD